MINWIRGKAPDFIIIGAQKSGTSSLFEDIMQHPHVLKPSKKEFHFFDNGFDQSLDTYFANFRKGLFKRQSQISGEASPYYVFHPLVPSRIYESIPDVKLILIIRDPIKRALSHFAMNKAKGIEKKSFEDALQFEKKVIQNEEYKLTTGRIKRSKIHQNYSYLARGLYADQLKRWLALFDRSSILTIFFEEYIKNQSTEFKKVTSFLDIAEVQVKPSWINASNDIENEIESRLIKELKLYFSKPNQDLFHLLGKENIWGY